MHNNTLLRDVLQFPFVQLVVGKALGLANLGQIVNETAKHEKDMNKYHSSFFHHLFHEKLLQC